MQYFRFATEVIAALLLIACIAAIVILVLVAFTLERYVSRNRVIANEISRNIRRVY